MRHFITLLLFAVCSVLSANETIIQLSEKIGDEIDLVEKKKYRLFQDIKGFHKARIIQVNNKYYVEYTIKNEIRPAVKRQFTSGPALEATQLHVKLVEEYENLNAGNTTKEAETLYRLGLRYSARTKYDLSPLLFNELITNYPTSPYAQKALAIKKDLNVLSSTKKALFLPGSLLDKSGRTEFLIFSGYYGVWLGMATPIYFDSGSPQVYALGLLLGGPASFLLSYNLTKEANISDGRAAMLILGGHLGTWQGIGWAVAAEADGNDAVGLGELAGLSGICIATALTHNYNFSTAHAGLTNYSMYWGAWFGLVLGNMTKSDDILRDMLITTDIAVVSTALLARDSNMSRTRYRFINLSGVLGTMVGFGLDLLIEVDNAQTAFTVAGIGSVAGLLIGQAWTKNMDVNKFSFLGKTEFRSEMAFKRHPILPNKVVPSVTLSLRF
jgi:hypothetical protein